jgi:hypothetical protein
MIGKYAYSFNGDHYRGAFDTREDAIADGIAAARYAESSPQTVFVGRIYSGDPKAGGHARAVISNMAARAREEFGDSASKYLTDLSKNQIESLDEALELVVRGWLHRNELMPTFFKVEAVGEYPVPEIIVSKPTETQREVQEIGSGEYEM